MSKNFFTARKLTRNPLIEAIQVSESEYSLKFRRDRHGNWLARTRNCDDAWTIWHDGGEPCRQRHQFVQVAFSNARSGFLGESQLAVLVSHLPADLQDFTRFGFLTGWRKGEIASLTWSDLDGDTIRLRGENSKNGESRVVPLVGELAKLIERRKAARRMDSRFIFHRDGTPVCEFRKAWATATRKAGLAGILYHDLRRSACRRMIRANVPQAVAMKISGHKTNSMFQRYAIVAESDLAQALEQTQAFRETDKAKVVSMR